MLPHILAFVRGAYPKMLGGGPAAAGYLRVTRTLFFALAAGKFPEVQGAFGASGLHARMADLSLMMLHGPCLTPEEEESAAEMCLLVPARLEHLIPAMPRMMPAVVRALRGGERSVQVALRVLDVWVDSFNPGKRGWGVNGWLVVVVGMGLMG